MGITARYVLHCDKRGCKEFKNRANLPALVNNSLSEGWLIDGTVDARCPEHHRILPTSEHLFAPFNAEWAKPRCTTCREFAEHPIHIRDHASLETLLLLVRAEYPGPVVTTDEISTWPQDVIDSVIAWASAVHLSASDNPVCVPRLPAVLARRA